MRRLVRVLILTGMVVGLGASGFMCHRVAERGRFVAAYSSHGAGPEGARALYELASRLGRSVARQTEDFSRLPRGGILVALGGCGGMTRSLSRFESAFLHEWVSAGGTLFLAGAAGYLPDDDRPPAWPIDTDAIGRECHDVEGYEEYPAEAWDEEPAYEPLPEDALEGDPNEGYDDSRADPEPPMSVLRDGGLIFLPADPVDAPPDAGVAGADVADAGVLDASFAIPTEPTYDSDVDPFDELASIVRGDPAEVVWAYPEGALEGLDWIGLRGPMRVATDDVEPEGLLYDEDGGLLAFATPVGEGHVIVFASASPFQNRDLVEEAGAIIFRRILDEYAPTGPVLFDEHHLGVGETRSILRYVRQIGGAGIALQVLLLVAWWLWRLAARFGGVRDDVPPPPGGIASYVQSMGGLYARTNDRRGAHRAIVEQGLAAVARHHRVRAKDPAELAKELRLRGRTKSAEAVELLGKELDLAIENDRTLTEAARTVEAIVERAKNVEGVEV